MTDAKKVSILEQLLDERDKQIRELQQQNAELEAILDGYSVLDDDVQELKSLISEARQLNSELNKAKNEQIQIKTEFRREMGTLFKKQK